MKNPVKTDASPELANPQNSGIMTDNFTPVYFDFDSAVVKDTESIMKISETLKSSNSAVQVAGHCDERGTTEYNLALGSRRATEVKNTLVQMGVQEGKITTISYGKEQPVEEGHTEAAWSKNRRAEFHVMR
jgi:peptidoglycan-associated lipoprotein